jgi:hypothetical protein
VVGPAGRPETGRLLAFVGTLAAARYFGEGKLFD